MERLTDYSPMPYGPYEGVALANVPADYLLNVYYRVSKNDALMGYIKDNLTVLEKEVAQITTDSDADAETWD